MFCTQCGKRNATDARFCFACGVPTVQSNGTNFRQNQPPWNNAVAALIVVGGILVLIVLAVVSTDYDWAAVTQPAIVDAPALGDKATEAGQRASRHAKAERAKHPKTAPRADPVALFNAAGRKGDPVYVAEQNNLDDNDAAKQAFLRGQIASNEGRHAQAAKFFERVLTIKQDNSRAHYGAALAYAELGNNARAEHHFSWFLLFASPDDGEQVRNAKAWLAVDGETPASHRNGRGAPLARRDD
jgi:Flp pilus assembly protein TadD